MKNVFITGATGNIGTALIQALLDMEGAPQIIAGVRSPENGQRYFPENAVELRAFDFEDNNTYSALAGCESLFLLRPPQLADVSGYFAPLLAAARQQGIGHLVFLSVQGAENSPMIPHHKIEKRHC